MSLHDIITTDCALIVDTDDFGVAATYNGNTIAVIFDAAGTIQTVGGVLLMVEAPQCHCIATDVADAAQGDTIVINGTTYYITQVLPDGTGITKLVLSEDA